MKEFIVITINSLNKDTEAYSFVNKDEAIKYIEKLYLREILSEDSCDEELTFIEEEYAQFVSADRMKIIEFRLVTI